MSGTAATILVPTSSTSTSSGCGARSIAANRRASARAAALGISSSGHGIANMPLSIRARLTLWYSALMALSLIAASLAVLWLHMWWGRAQFDSELASLGAETARVVQEEFSESGDLRRAVLEASNSLDVPNRAMAILDPHGTPMFARF